VSLSVIVAILFGERVPYILRAARDNFKFIRECNVPGLMDSEAIQIWIDEGNKRKIFELV
jgi:hypothetical protein